MLDVDTEGDGEEEELGGGPEEEDVDASGGGARFRRRERLSSGKPCIKTSQLTAPIHPLNTGTPYGSRKNGASSSPSSWPILGLPAEERVANGSADTSPLANVCAISACVDER